MQTDIAARRAALTPAAPAILFRGHWHDYADLDRRARRLAGRLAAAGVRKGDRVGILALNHLAHFDLMLAAPKLGFIHTPFNCRLPAAEQRALGAYVEPKLVLHDERHAALARAFGAPLQPLEGYDAWLAQAPEPPAVPPPGPEDAAMILFTGGSTGTPKGALIPYRQQLHNAVNTALSWDLGAGDCAIQATPAFHAAVNVLSTPLLHAGGRVILAEAFEPGEYLALASAHRATVLFLVPTMYQMLADHADFGRTDLSHVRWAVSGGAPCPAPVQQRFAARGIRFRQGYGLTEAGVNCFTIGSGEAGQRPGSVGKPMPHTEAAIRDADGHEVARGGVGELTLRGPHLCLGYYRRPEDTAASFRDGWLWTGDLARQDDDDFYYIVGRRKEMYISGGENVYPVEVEAALYEQEEIAEAAVVGVPHERWGESGLAAVALRPGRRLDADTLRARLKQRLAGYKVPLHVLFLETLPKSGAGKILKPEIRRLFESGR